MKKPNLHIAFAVIIFALIVLLSGCAIGIRPRSHDASSEDDIYYEEAVSDSYSSSTGSRSSDYHRDPNYNPWTMGTYYQYYSGPSRAGGSDTESNLSESKRPAVSSRDSASQAPGDNSKSLKTNRSSIRDLRKQEPAPVPSPITRQKARTTTQQSSSRTSQREKASEEASAKQRQPRPQINSQKARIKPDESKAKDEDENKKSQD